MFVKPFRVKSQTAIKGSDRKKLRQEVCRRYPGVDEDEVAIMIPNKEEMQIAKIYTHSGENVVMYVLKKNPIFFEVDNNLYPTVYTTWKYPDMLPTFTTFPDVHHKIVGGADLMLPGVIVPGDVTPHSLGNLPKGALCGVKLLGNKSPVAVGCTALSSEDMYASAMKGKGVIIFHTYKDQLWAHGDKSVPPVVDDPEFNVPSSIAAVAPGDTEAGGSCMAAEAHLITPMMQSLHTGRHQEWSQHSGGESSGSNSPVNLHEDEEAATEAARKSVQERMDELLMWCFKCALKMKVSKNDLPLLTSTFQRNCLQACCPNDKFLDLKKTKYKKLSRFLHDMEEEGYIKVKELEEGVHSITEIFRDQPELRSFKVDESELPVVEAGGEGEEEAFSYQPPQVADVYQVTGNTQAFFKPYGHNKGAALSAQAVRKHLNDYVKENKLQDEEKKAFVRLDPLLADMVQKKDDYRELLRWEEILTALLAKMTAAYEITFPGQRPAVKKGKLEPITFTTAKRMGNKKVTLVDNLEQYGIDPAVFAHQVQTSVSVSTSVQPHPSKKTGVQVTVQGNQITYITKLLTEKYKLPKKWLQGVDKAPKSGKKR